MEAEKLRQTKEKFRDELNKNRPAVSVEGKRATSSATPLVYHAVSITEAV